WREARRCTCACSNRHTEAPAFHRQKKCVALRPRILNWRSPNYGKLIVCEGPVVPILSFTGLLRLTVTQCPDDAVGLNFASRVVVRAFMISVTLDVRLFGAWQPPVAPGWTAIELTVAPGVPP